MINRPLEGFRILAIEQFGAGPYGSMYMADWGAEVIKIENRFAGGDPARRTGAYLLGESDSEYFQAFNLSKKSVTLNLKSDQGREIFLQMVSKADVVWNNLRGSQPKKMGLDYESLKSVNPNIVCTHISAYGRDNDRAQWPGYDYLMQAECGFLSMTGEPDSPPARFGLSMVDFMTGVVAGFGTLAALLGRDKSGGCDVDVSLFDVALHQLSYTSAWYLNHGAKTSRIARSAHPANTPVQLYKTQDSWIFVMCMTDKFWQLLVNLLEHPELENDSRFNSMANRTRHRDELTEILDSIFATRATDDWIKVLQTNVPVGPVYDMGQALDNPFVVQNGMIQEVPHETAGSVRTLRSPVKVNGRRFDSEAGHDLGADNDRYVGAELGLDRQLDQLRKDGII